MLSAQQCSLACWDKSYLFLLKKMTDYCANKIHRHVEKTVFDAEARLARQILISPAWRALQQKH